MFFSRGVRGVPSGEDKEVGSIILVFTREMLGAHLLSWGLETGV